MRRFLFALYVNKVRENISLNEMVEEAFSCRLTVVSFRVTGEKRNKIKTPKRINSLRGFLLTNQMLFNIKTFRRHLFECCRHGFFLLMHGFSLHQNGSLFLNKLNDFPKKIDLGSDKGF